MNLREEVINYLKEKFTRPNGEMIHNILLINGDVCVITDLRDGKFVTPYVMLSFPFTREGFERYKNEG